VKSFQTSRSYLFNLWTRNNYGATNSRFTYSYRCKCV